MNKPSLLIISSSYPSLNNVYGDVFVHTRAKEYTGHFDVNVIGYNPGEAVDEYNYEGIDVYKTGALDDFCEKVLLKNPDVIVVHFIQQEYMDFLASLDKPLAIFIHGFEVLSWKRRQMNYRAPGDLPYLLQYIKQNRIQLNALAKFQKQVEKKNNTSFVFVSQWLKSAAQKDLNVSFSHGLVIPNGIDTRLFRFEKKNPDLRKKILILRSFKGRNYANDISIEAILKLSKKEYFNELEFCIYGQGYLFNPLTDKVKHFTNVTLNNTFVENKDIPAIHKEYGIFLSPSRLDTQGVSMCEAMASGLVPITSPTGGIPEYAEHGSSAFFTNSVDEVVAAIEKIYHEPQLFLKMSQNASEAVHQKCSLNNTVQAEVNLFNSLSEASSRKIAYQQCNHCILDTNDDPHIRFNAEGKCSYCQEYERTEATLLKGEKAEREYERIIQKIKTAGAGKDYDCILGLSGGVDSTYLAYKAKEAGLRPLAVHFDNGWNSELAVGNIENIVNRLDIPLYTFVVDWDEFKDIQLSLMNASVVDIEIATDHAIITKLYQLALKFKINYIISGSNIVTESILPLHWIHNKKDHVNIRSIHQQFGKVPLKTYPLFTSLLKWRVSLRNIQSISLLDLLPYNKKEVKELITTKLGWRDYGGKHYESVFTRFYQGHILPQKFGIDKRRAHLSNLICSGQISRDEALEELKKPGYDESVCKHDYNFVLKKLDLTEEAFQRIMRLPAKAHTSYPTEGDFYKRFPVARLAAPVWRLFKKIKTRV